MAVKCDVTNEEDILAVFEVAKAQFGGVDVCVNNAGLAHNAPLLSGATSVWRNMLEVYMHVVLESHLCCYNNIATVVYYVYIVHINDHSGLCCIYR